MVVHNLDERMNVWLSYITSSVGFLSQVDWMAVGAMVLLLSRLVVDIPKAIKSIKEMCNGKGDS